MHTRLQHSIRQLHTKRTSVCIPAASTSCLLHLSCQTLRTQNHKTAATKHHKTPQERFQPYFAEAGYESWAVSLRSQGGSERQQGVKVAGTLDSHAADLAEVVQQLGAAPVMVPHSFGGLIAQK